MTEWWTYRPSDFLMFSPRSYWRLIELHNLELWPGQLAALLIGAGLCAAVLQGRARAGRVAVGVLALCWLAVALLFHVKRYASINTAAPWFALAFAAEAVLLIALALAMTGPVARRPLSRGALALLVVAVFVYPVIGVAAGRVWTQAEVFAIAPDPTVLATLGTLLLLRPHPQPPPPAARWLWRAAWLVPLMWCLGSGLTLWNLQAPDAPLLPAAALLALWLAWRGRRG